MEATLETKPAEAHSSGFNAMGKPIPTSRREKAYMMAKEIGIDTFEERVSLVNEVANKLERDQPYEAQAAAMKYVDLTGSYMIMAALLTD